jgi:hypothetical protein
MRRRITIFSLLLGLLFPCICHSQTSVDALRGSSDAAQGVFDRISGNANKGSVPDTIYDVRDVQVAPQYPNGAAAMVAFLANSVSHPSGEDDIQGKVLVEFVVGKDGAVRNVKLREGVPLDRSVEVIRAIESMPTWTPGSISGKFVNTRYLIPINICPQSSAPAKD